MSSFAYIATPPCVLIVLEKCVISLYPFIFMWSKVSKSCQCSVMRRIWGFSFVRKFSRIGTFFAMHCMFWCIILVLSFICISSVCFSVFCFFHVICLFAGKMSFLVGLVVLFVVF
uniref:Uncharacterized protein n=1 Tax=Cacopsylla melanoneura TaxID=428564 RepID=A0A8D8LGC5_9HEMI